MFAFDFVLLLLRRKFHIVMLWSISLLINHGAGEKKVKVAQLCPTLQPHGLYTVHGILQARILEWVAFPFSRGSSQPRD